MSHILFLPYNLVMLYQESNIRINRSSHRRCSTRKDILRNFAKFRKIHVPESLF